MATLQLRDIGKQYDTGPQVIKRVDMDIEDGEFVVFVGPSGCGKSTMLRMIAGLETITAGDLFIDGVRANDIIPSERGVAMVFQSYALYPHMTVGENMGFALKMSGRSPSEIEAAVGRAAEILQLSHLLDRKPKALSGGQRQRVAIGRAIVRKPKVFLFDEPLSNLDASLRVMMRIELAKLHRELGATMIYVTHDQVEAMTLGTRIAVFNQGIVEQMGRPLDLYERPNKQFVASFLGSPTMNFLPCSASKAGDGGTQIDLGGGYQVALPVDMRSGVDGNNNGPLVLGIRPEHIEISTDGQGIPAQVEYVEHLGDHHVLYSRLVHNQQRVIAKIPMTAHTAETDGLVALRLESRWCRVFDKDGAVVNDKQ